MLTTKSNRKQRELQRKNKIQQSSSALGNNPVLGRSRDGAWLIWVTVKQVSDAPTNYLTAWKSQNHIHNLTSLLRFGRSQYIPTTAQDCIPYEQS